MLEIESIKCEFCEKKMEWIPCSERMPEEGQNCLITVNNPIGVYILTAIYSEEYKWENFVTAWMPLPEAYKGEDHDS